MSKIPLRKILTDDCPVHVGRIIEDGKITSDGEAYYPHEKEWIKVIPITSVRQFIAWDKLRLALSGDMERMEQGLDMMCQSLSTKIVEWNWTDNQGNKLPQPHNNPQVLANLTEDELLYLFASVIETPGQRKNADTPSA